MVLSGVSRRIGLVYRVSGVPVHLFPIGGSDFPDGIGSGPYGSRLARIPTGSAPLDTAMRHFYLYRAVVFNFLSPRCGSGDQGNVASCPTSPLLGLRARSHFVARISSRAKSAP